MASTDAANIKRIEAPQTADHVSFREWIRVEVLWSTIVQIGLDLYLNTSYLHKHIGPGESFEDFMEACKEVHRKDAFSYESGLLKSKGKQEGADVKKVLHMAASRCVCRWLLGRGLSARLAQKFFEVLDPSHKDCVFTTVQLARNFNKPIYKSLPWFLEYPEGKFAAHEELRHNSAVKEREERVNKQAIVLHVPPKPKEGEAVESMPAASNLVDEHVEAMTQSSQPSQQAKATTSQVFKKRKHSKMTPTDAEMEEFSNSLEEHIGECSDVMLKYTGKGFDGGSINICHINEALDTATNKENILSIVDSHCQLQGRITQREEEWVNASVSVAYIFVPTNEAIYGIPSDEVPKWNQMEMEEFGKVARLIHAILEDSGIFVVLCTPNQHQMVWNMVGAAGWTEDHVTMAVCKVPIYKETSMTKRSLLISVWKKIYAPIDLDIRKPKEDTWFDTHVEQAWTIKDGQPLRGGLERGHCFLYQLLKVYTKRNDVVVQYGGDNGVFALLGSQMGRYMLIVEKDETFCQELPLILQAKADKLNNRKAVEETTEDD